MNGFKLADHLTKLFPKIEGIVAQSKDKVFLGDCAEGGTIDGIDACSYYGGFEDPHEKIWITGVHRKLFDALHEAGWFAECYDPGTYFAFKI